MKKRLKRIEPLQAGIVCAAFYSLLTALMFLIMIPFLAIGAIASKEGPGSLVGIGAALAMVIFLPLVYGVFGFIFGALAAFVYNLIAKYLGGLIVTVEEVQAPAIQQPSGPPEIK